MRRHTFICTAWLLLALAACGDSTADPEHDDAGSAMPFCVRYAAFSADIGCGSQIECSTISDECDQAAQTWLDCVSQDVSQCLCESDGDPNCEGSYKPSEGPALCVSEFDALQACLNE